MKKKIKCSIVGLGRIGSLLEKDKKREKPATHAGSIYRHKECRILSGCDIKKDRNSLFSKTWNCPKVFENYQDLLNDEVPEILHIATPPEVHYEICKLALQKKIPVIICEKPFTNSVKEAKALLQLSQSTNTKIIINHERRYSQDYLDLKKIIAQKKYGHLLNINARLYMGFGQSPKDLLWYDGTHMIDILRFLTNKELEYKYLEGDLNKTKSICTIIFKADNLDIELQAATDRQYLVFELDLFFDKALIRIGNGIFEIFKSKSSPFYENFLSLIPQKNHRYKNTGYFINMLNEAVNMVKYRDKTKIPSSNISDGVKSVEIIQSLLL